MPPPRWLEWRRVYRTAGRIRQRLDRLGAVRSGSSPAGTDLEIAAGAQRTWAGVSGRNIPSFEIFVSPDWPAPAEVFYADQPSYRSGNIVRGVRLEFRDGRVVRARAAEGEAFLRRQIAMESRRGQVGELSADRGRRLSPIDRFMANTLFDENFGGAQGRAGVGLGSSYANTYTGAPVTAARAPTAPGASTSSALQPGIAADTERKRG